MAETDPKSAFRQIPIHPDDRDLLGIHWQSQYYVDIYLPCNKLSRLILACNHLGSCEFFHSFEQFPLSSCHGINRKLSSRRFRKFHKLS